MTTDLNNKATELAFSTKRIDKDACTAAALALYAAHSLPAPEIVFTVSPEAAMVEISKRLGKPASYQGGFIAGASELYWLYHYLSEPTTKQPKALHETIRLCEEAGWWWPFDTVCVISDRPTGIYSTPGPIEEARRHRTDGPAIEFSDGTGPWMLNGVRMTGFEKLFAADASPKDILNITNVEQRAELIKLHGAEKFVERIAQALDSKTIDGYTTTADLRVVPHKFEYTLYTVSIYPDMPRKALRMSNPSVPGDHPFEWVHPDCNTVEEALEWRNMGTITGNWQMPAVLT